MDGSFAMIHSDTRLCGCFGVDTIPIFRPWEIIFPGQKVLAVWETSGGHCTIDIMDWDLIPADTAGNNKSTSVRHQLGMLNISGIPKIPELHSHRRCLIPMSGYFVKTDVDTMDNPDTNSSDLPRTCTPVDPESLIIDKVIAPDDICRADDTCLMPAVEESVMNIHLSLLLGFLEEKPIHGDGNTDMDQRGSGDTAGSTARNRRNSPLNLGAHGF